MTTEAEIREAYERITAESGFKQTVGGFILFKAGYLTLLYSLVEADVVLTGEILYALPEGVTRG